MASNSEITSNANAPWVIVVFLNNVAQTLEAVKDALAQTCHPNVLLIDNGCVEEYEDQFEKLGQVYLWPHNPPLRSLAATWNAALDFVFKQPGQESALVINNDVRLQTKAYVVLKHEARRRAALFISGVGVTKEQFDLVDRHGELLGIADQGGPDFSCYLISKECHEKYRFDENYIPCYVEDVDYHRRLLLAGDGDKIFSVNVPYLHIDSGSGTLKAMSPVARTATEAMINNGSRAYHVRKWGGPVNQELFDKPFDDEYQSPDNSTTALFDKVRQQWNKK